MKGKCLNRIFTRPLLTYSRIICCPGPRVKLAQAGHWKSPNSTSVTGASGFPINDPPEARVELSIASSESLGESATNVIVAMATTTIATPTISIQFFCTVFPEFLDLLCLRSCLEVNFNICSQLEQMNHLCIKGIRLDFSTGEYHVTNSALSFVCLNMVSFGDKSISFHVRDESWFIVGRPDSHLTFVF